MEEQKLFSKSSRQKTLTRAKQLATVLKTIHAATGARARVKLSWCCQAQSTQTVATTLNTNRSKSHRGIEDDLFAAVCEVDKIAREN